MWNINWVELCEVIEKWNKVCKVKLATENWVRITWGWNNKLNTASAYHWLQPLATSWSTSLIKLGAAREDSSRHGYSVVSVLLENYYTQTHTAVKVIFLHSKMLKGHMPLYKRRFFWFKDPTSEYQFIRQSFFVGSAYLFDNFCFSLYIDLTLVII